MLSFLLSSLRLCQGIAAYIDHDLRDSASHPQVPLTPSSTNAHQRPLVWGNLNVIHTTDIHGWLLGHQESSWPEPNYNGTLGDFASFVKHMKDIAEHKGVDLLLVDSGDLHDGTGIVHNDEYASMSNSFMQLLPYDLMAIGNHELYEYPVTYNMHTNFAPRLNGRYLSSNVNLTVVNSQGKAESVPVGQRYAKFTTLQKRKVTSFGIHTERFKGAANTMVQPIGDMVKEKWFQDVIDERPDVFILVGHMPVDISDRDNKWDIVGRAIRLKHPNTPILIFGGHSHIRYCQQYDIPNKNMSRTIGLQSGRYMETIGWMSINLDKAEGRSDELEFTRRYLDQNRATYIYHTNKTNNNFDTPLGQDINHDLRLIGNTSKLTRIYGYVPQDYTLYWDPYDTPRNALKMFIDEVVPYALTIDDARSQIPHIILSNNGVLRYDILQGPFTGNDQLTASPYPDQFAYVPDVTARIAKQVLPLLNQPKLPECSPMQAVQWDLGPAESRARMFLHDMYYGNQELTSVVDPTLTPGYVTKDACPDGGYPVDDTKHNRLVYHPPPHYIGSTIKPFDVPDQAPMDLVFLNQARPMVLCILYNLTGIDYTKDVSLYSAIPTSEMLGLYAQHAWKL